MEQDYELTQAQIADAVNRSGLGNTQRQRRELMRLGTSDPYAFKQKYSNFLTFPTQPVQNVIQQPQDNYSFFDYNTPTDNFTISDLGLGKYNILDPSGTTLGTGYKSLDDTIKDLTKDYATKYNALLPFRNPQDAVNGDFTKQSTYDETGQLINPYMWKPKLDEFGLPTEFSPPALPSIFGNQKYEDVMSKYLKPNPVDSYSYNEKDTGGDLGKWEVIGNLLQGQALQEPINTGGRGFVGDPETESFKGLDTLFGSTPVFKNGQFAGYKMNLGPATSDLIGYQNPFFVKKQDLNGGQQSQAYLGRELVDQDKWKQLVQKINSDPNDYNMFVSKDNAANLPGWNNKSDYKYQKEHSGIFGNSFLDSVLPLALGFVAPPLGAALGGLNSLAATGTGFGALSAGLGTSGIFNQLGSSLGVSPQVGGMLGTAGLNTIFDAAQGKDFNLAKLGSNLAGSLVGTSLGNSLGSENLAGPAAGALVKQGLYNVLSKRRK